MPKAISPIQIEIAQSLHDGLAAELDEIGADLAEVIGRSGLTPQARTTLREIAHKQNQLSTSLRAHILELQGKDLSQVTQMIKVRELQPLTKKEVEVLQLLATALSAQEISEKLFISLATVKTHIASIYRKFGVKNRTSALTSAREAGLLLPQ